MGKLKCVPCLKVCCCESREPAARNHAQPRLRHDGRAGLNFDMIAALNSKEMLNIYEENNKNTCDKVTTYYPFEQHVRFHTCLQASVVGLEEEVAPKFPVMNTQYSEQVKLTSAEARLASPSAAEWRSGSCRRPPPM